MAPPPRIILRERPGGWIVGVVAYGARAAKRAGHVRRIPDVVRQNLRRHGIEHVLRDDVGGKWISRPGSVGETSGRVRIVQLGPHAAKGKVAPDLVRCRSLAGVRL